MRVAATVLIAVLGVNPAPRVESHAIALHRIVVHIANFAFAPADTTVAPGDTVVWINDDDFEHVVAADSAAWKSPTLTHGQQFILVAGSAGRVPYHCAAHPVMHGALTIAR